MIYVLCFNVSNSLWYQTSNLKMSYGSRYINCNRGRLVSTTVWRCSTSQGQYFERGSIEHSNIWSHLSILSCKNQFGENDLIKMKQSICFILRPPIIHCMACIMFSPQQTCLCRSIFMMYWSIQPCYSHCTTYLLFLVIPSLESHHCKAKHSFLQLNEWNKGKGRIKSLILFSKQQLVNFTMVHF